MLYFVFPPLPLMNTGEGLAVYIYLVSSYVMGMLTLSKVQKICVILGRSENTFLLLQWLSMGKQILKHKKIKKTHITRIILHNYILYNGDLT